MAIESMNGYSLWLLPALEAADSFQNIIRNLGETFDGPLFPPHITVIGAGAIKGAEEQLKERVEKLAQELSPFPIHFTGIEFEDVWHRCLFLRAEKSAALVDLHNQASEMFGKTPSTSYMPHLSLLYGEFPREEKPKMAESIGGYPDSCTIDRLALYNVTGMPNEWSQVIRISL